MELIEIYGLGSGLAALITLTFLYWARNQSKATLQTAQADHHTQTTMNRIAMREINHAAQVTDDLVRRMETIALMGAKIAKLEGDVAFLLAQKDIDLKEKLAMKQKIQELEVQVKHLEQENQTFRQRNLTLDEENQTLREQVTTLRERISDLEELIKQMKEKEGKA